MGFFDSPREQQGPDLMQGQIGKYDDVIRQILGSRSSFGGTSNLGDVQKNFGISPFDMGGYQSQVGGVFNPLRQGLNTQAGQARKRSFSRYGAQGTPEFASTDINANLAQGLGNLGSQEGSARLAGYDKQTAQNNYTGDFLRSILGQKDQFGQQRLGAYGNAVGGRGNAINGYLGSLSGASTFDDLLGGVATASKFVKPFIG